MTQDDKKRFLQIMAGLAENFGAQTTREGIAMRFAALAEYSIEQVEQAAYKLLRNRKYTTMPTVADFIEHMNGGNVADRAEIEAAKVCRAVAEVGAYGTVAFDDPVTQAVIEYGYGGWPKLCHCDELDRGDHKWFRHSFVKIYTSYSNQGLEYRGALPGITDAANQLNGYERDEGVALVGDQSKAQGVLDSQNDNSRMRITKTRDVNRSIGVDERVALPEPEKEEPFVIEDLDEHCEKGKQKVSELMRSISIGSGE
jgi:hypothetical protein